VGKWNSPRTKEKRWLFMAIIEVQREATMEESRMPREMTWEGN
jgi:hypothetical protein